MFCHGEKAALYEFIANCCASDDVKSGKFFIRQPIAMLTSSKAIVMITQARVNSLHFVLAIHGFDPLLVDGPAALLDHVVPFGERIKDNAHLAVKILSYFINGNARKSKVAC